MGYSFRLAARFLVYVPSHRQDSTYHCLCYSSRGVLAVTTNSSMSRPRGINATTHHGAYMSRDQRFRSIQHNKELRIYSNLLLRTSVKRGSYKLGQSFRPRQKQVWVGRRVGYLATTFALKVSSHQIKSH